MLARTVLALGVAIALAGCGGGAPSVSSLPLASHARVIDTGTGGDGMGDGDPQQYRRCFIAQQGTSSSQLMLREVDLLQKAGWKVTGNDGADGGFHVPIGTQGSVTTLESHAADLSVSLAMVNTLSDAEGQSEDALGLNRLVLRDVGNVGMLFATASARDGQ